MNKYILALILKDDTEIKVETGEISYASLITEIKNMIELENDFFFERGSIKIEFTCKDIKKIEFKRLEDK